MINRHSFQEYLQVISVARRAFIIHSVNHELIMSRKSTYICRSLRELINTCIWHTAVYLKRSHCWGYAFLQIARSVADRSRKSICVTENSERRGERKIARTYVSRTARCRWENRFQRIFSTWKTPRSTESKEVVLCSSSARISKRRRKRNGGGVYLNRRSAARSREKWLRSSATFSRHERVVSLRRKLKSTLLRRESLD